jgi:hypothetical protein
MLSPTGGDPFALVCSTACSSQIFSGDVLLWGGGAQDTGYAATNTLAGTRLNTAIANTPVALSVMTREFLNDIGAIDGNRAIEYALNADNDTSDATGNSVTMSASTSSNTTRMAFTNLRRLSAAPRRDACRHLAALQGDNRARRT